MFQKEDEAHLKIINEMKKFMQASNAMNEWFDNKLGAFNAL